MTCAAGDSGNTVVPCRFEDHSSTGGRRAHFRPAKRFRRMAAGLFSLVLAAFPQSHTMQQGQYRMELMLERLDGDTWHTIDPGLVLEQGDRSEEHTSELQSHSFISYAVFCL